MPITKSAKKALRQSLKKKAYNDRRKKTMKEISKKVIRLAHEKSKDAKEALRLAYKAIDKAAKNGTIKKNTASRKKSRLARMVK